MFYKLLPRSAPYFEYFRQQNAMMQEMSKFLTAVISEEQNAEEILKYMYAKEDEADALYRTILQDLSQTFITPIDREDIYAISTAQERIIDNLLHLGTRFFLLSFPYVRFPAQKMITNMDEMSKAVRALLDNLKNPLKAKEAVHTLHDYKETCDMLLGVGLGELLDLEVTSFEQIKQLMAWTHLYDRIEQTVKLYSSLRETLQQAVLKYA